MRVTAKDINSSLTVNAIPGLNVILFGLDIKQEETVGFLGFAIERTDYTENEKYFLKGFKTFKEIGANLPDGIMVSTHEHPVQSFMWGDYTAKPAHKYMYRFIAMYGQPKNLIEKYSVQINVSTFDPSDNNLPQIAFFNRGVAGSQAYASKFGKKPPKDVPDNEAWKWLSNGLEESLLNFIGQANGNGTGLRCAFYEFNNEAVLTALKNAAMNGADVQILFDARHTDSGKTPKKSPYSENINAIKKIGINKLCKGREVNPSYIAHNKFMVLLENDIPTQVWTGSVNISDSGIFGHANVGHIIRDVAIAKKFNEYWIQLHKDPDSRTIKTWDDEASDKAIPEAGNIALFSPRSDLSALEWYAQLMNDSNGPVFFTAAFGINAKLQDILMRRKNYLRYILLETEASRAKQNNLLEIKKDPNNRVAVGSYLLDKHTRFLKEGLTGLNVHVKYVHTKFMIIDPLGDDPILITGSANFSDASTTQNDENMIISRGNTDITDIYLGEFMRLFNHFYARDWINAKGNDDKSAYLCSDESWTALYFDPSNAKCKQREYFKNKQY
jgi:phosphatidylserine/phosphatidylglycerophosphate/cardiolipin synthase-like enzyme